MKKLTKTFLEQLMKKINTIMTVYYEEAPKSASFPFGVVPTLSITPLDYGYQCLFDIEIYINELSLIDVETLCDNLRSNLDGYHFKNKDIGFHIGFENQYLTKENEQDLSMRRISFIARIF